MRLGVALGVVLGAFLLSAGSTWAQAPVDPSLKGGLLPQYPRVPQLAHISGDVRASFKIDDSGNVTDIAIVSGPEMLKAPTEASLRSWKFYTADSGAVAVKGRNHIQLPNLGWLRKDEGRKRRTNHPLPIDTPNRDSCRGYLHR
jgi:TonB family protein